MPLTSDLDSDSLSDPYWYLYSVNIAYMKSVIIMNIIF